MDMQDTSCEYFSGCLSPLASLKIRVSVNFRLLTRDTPMTVPDLPAQATKELPMTIEEAVFAQAGFDCIPRGKDQFVFRRFFRVRELEPLWAARLYQLGGKPSDEVSLCYSRPDNSISTYLMSSGLLIEFEADSARGRNLMWGFGIDPFATPDLPL